MACCKRSFANCMSTCQLALSYARTYQYIHTYIRTYISWSMSSQNAFPVFFLLRTNIPWNIRIFPDAHIHLRLPLHQSLLQLHYYICLHELPAQACLAWTPAGEQTTHSSVDSRDIEQASVWPPDQIEEMSLPVARQLILIERSKSLFEWLVLTLFGLALALALDWLRTKGPYLLLHLT